MDENYIDPSVFDGIEPTSLANESSEEPAIETDPEDPKPEPKKKEKEEPEPDVDESDVGEEDPGDDDEEEGELEAKELAETDLVKVGDEEIEYKELLNAYKKQAGQQRYFTQRTQELSEQINEAKAVVERNNAQVQRMMSDPQHLLLELRKYAPDVLEQAMITYAGEVQELMELRERDLGEYHRKVTSKEQEIKRLRAEDDAAKDAAKAKRESYAAQVREVESMVKSIGPKALSKAGLMVRGKAPDPQIWNRYIQQLQKTSTRAKITEEALFDAAREVADDDLVKAYVAAKMPKTKAAPQKKKPIKGAKVDKPRKKSNYGTDTANMAGSVDFSNNAGMDY